MNHDQKQGRTTMSIDLSKCVVDQKVRLRDGSVVTFDGGRDSEVYPFTAGGETYTKGGFVWSDRLHSNYDIVEILPIEQNQQQPATMNRTDSLIQLTKHLASAQALANCLPCSTEADDIVEAIDDLLAVSVPKLFCQS